MNPKQARPKQQILNTAKGGTDIRSQVMSRDQKQNQVKSDDHDGQPNKEEMIPVNGFLQVLEMFKGFDPAFRDDFIRRIAARNRDLAMSIIRELK